MTGRGIWPDFGHNFTSFAVVGEPGVQLTGGAFFNGREMIANIAGIALPQTDENTPWPELSGPENPADLGLAWTGTLREVSPRGEVVSEEVVCRTYESTASNRRFTERVNSQESLHLKTEENRKRLMVSGHIANSAVHGLGKQYGWLVEFELCLANGSIVEWMEVLDADRSRLVGIRRWWTDGLLNRVEILNLAPETA